jgi:mannosyl-3-phosphoglycerate phosphatase
VRQERDLLVATDLDGCLLDASYSYEAARPALAALAKELVPLVLVSSKTREEMEPLVRVLGLDTPFVVENGGALVVPRRLVPAAERTDEDEPYVEIPLGTPRRVLVAALHEMAARAGVTVRGFAGLTSTDLERLTGLSNAAATRALRRHYDEPFLVEGGDEVAARLAHAAGRRGLMVTRGGQFHHLSGRVGKGDALARLFDVLGTETRRRFVTVGLGDAESDLSLLQEVDRPIVIPRANGGLEPALAAALPRAERAPSPGPSGWNHAVLAVLRGDRLPSVAA